MEKGKPFRPDARMKKILTNAVAIANAAARSIVWYPRVDGTMKGVELYPDTHNRQRLVHPNATDESTPEDPTVD